MGTASTLTSSAPARSASTMTDSTATMTPDGTMRATVFRGVGFGTSSTSIRPFPLNTTAFMVFMTVSLFCSAETWMH